MTNPDITGYAGTIKKGKAKPNKDLELFKAPNSEFYNIDIKSGQIYDRTKPPTKLLVKLLKKFKKIFL